MKDHLPPEARRLYGEIEDLQDDAEAVREQRERAAARLDDVEASLDALADVEDASVYRTVGRVRIETGPEKARAALESEADRLRERVEQLEATEQDLREQFENRKRDIEHLLGGHAGRPGGAGASGDPGPPGGPDGEE